MKREEETKEKERMAQGEALAKALDKKFAELNSALDGGNMMNKQQAQSASSGQQGSQQPPHVQFQQAGFQSNAACGAAFFEPWYDAQYGHAGAQQPRQSLPRQDYVAMPAIPAMPAFAHHAPQAQGEFQAGGGGVLLPVCEDTCATNVDKLVREAFRMAKEKEKEKEKVKEKEKNDKKERKKEKAGLSEIDEDELVLRIARQVASVIQIGQGSESEKRKREEGPSQEQQVLRALGGEEQGGNREKVRRAIDLEDDDTLREVQAQLASTITMGRLRAKGTWDEETFTKEMTTALKHDATAKRVKDWMEDKGLCVQRGHVARAKQLWQHLRGL